MFVYDVVQVVRPGAMTSTPAGRWFVQSFGLIRRARDYAELCQQHATVPGIAYVVERHDDECGGRARSRTGLDAPAVACACPNWDDVP